MNRNRWIPTLVALIIISLLAIAASFPSPQDTESRVEALLAKMTLDEKIGQLVQYSGINDKYRSMIRQGKIGSLLNVTGAAAANAAQQIALKESRLGIPLLLGLDVIHGYRTIFPIPLAEASSWEPSLVEKAARIAAKEAAAAGVRWTFAPMVDIARDPRWGRIAEGSGEDPYLGSAMAAARVRGFQGAVLADPESIVACAKHYVAYGAAEGGRDYNTVDISEKTLREVYLPPFQAAVGAGAATLMSAFNSLSGVPASANRFTLTEVLRNEWGFGGFVVSDWNSIGELLNHGVAADASEAARLALDAGVDMDMQGGVYAGSLAALVKEGKISEAAVTEAARRILRVKFRLGLFDRPYTDPAREPSVVLSKENVDAAREAAGKCMVLLKNTGNLLPLRKDIRSIAVIGPLADNKNAPLGPWAANGRAEDVVTVLTGIRNKLTSSGRILYAKGCDITGTPQDAFAEALRVARSAQVAVVVVGESADMSGEAASRASLDLPGSQNDLVKKIHELGTPVVLVLMNGRPLTISWAAENVAAILETWFLGVQAGNAIADVLFGDVNPSGKLPVSFPYSVGQVPVHYNHMNTGRPPTADRWTSKYIDAPVAPLFPFGFGLSYTKFEYSNLQLSAKSIERTGSVTVSAEVQNTGAVPGDEVVQLYLRDMVSTTIRPVKELKGFRRLTLAPGEKHRVEFVLGPEQLGFYGRDMKFVVEPGTFKVWIGLSSVQGLEGSFEVTGN